MFVTKLNDLLRVLNKRADKQREKCKHHADEIKPRQDGPDFECEPPKSSWKWAINRLWMKDITLISLQ